MGLQYRSSALRYRTRRPMQFIAVGFSVSQRECWDLTLEQLIRRLAIYSRNLMVSFREGLWILLIADTFGSSLGICEMARG